MKAFNHELQVLKFDLIKCIDPKTGKPYHTQATRANEIAVRIKALQNVMRKLH